MVTRKKQEEDIWQVVSRVGLNLVGAESKQKVRQALWGYIFVAPWVIGLAVFTVGPMLASFYYGMTEFDGIASPKFIGIDNYIKAFTEDDFFWSSLGKTMYYALIVVPLGTIGSLLLALLLNQKIPGRNLFRTAFFLPHLTPTVATAILWLFVLHPHIGPVNILLQKLGVPKIGWLYEAKWAIPSVILISLWAGVGGNRMLIFLAGLQGVPTGLIEAAEIDGASAWEKFRHVTIPMISPTIFFNLVLGIIGALKVFGLSYVATRGGPSYATWFFALHIYVQSFDYYRMGYGCALAWIFTLLLLIFTYIQFRYSERWVYYAGS